MRTYKLINGYRVKSTRREGGSVEFVTTSPDRETVSTVVKSGQEAEDIMRDLFVADALRFGVHYGRGASNTR